MFFFFFFNDTATTEFYTLSLHDALPIYTVRTLNGPGGPGIQRATWNFAGKTPPPQPLSPSQKRDSTLIVARIAVVFDSLAKAGMPAAQLDPIKDALLKGDVQGLAA